MLVRPERHFLQILAVGVFGLSLAVPGIFFIVGLRAAPSPVDELAEAWARSPHAQVESESFTHWDPEGEVPVNCAACHSGPGYRDFIGADGSAAGVVDHPAPIRSVIDCETCHNAAAGALASVTFPSGTTVDRDLGTSARCMVCHQGRESKFSVDKAIGQLEDDVVSAELSFRNIHYRAAAASLFGTLAKGAYEYDGKEYFGRSEHPKLTLCADCHDPHSVEVRLERCGACHENQKPTAIRSLPVDGDGDGDVTEGIAVEIAAMHEALLAAIGKYASTVAGKPIVYSPDTHPYFFGDNNGNGIADPDETVGDNRYKSWTPRLLRAAYNYQFVAKDPGIYAHNPRYAMQILFDSTESLGARAALDAKAMKRP